MFILLAHNTTGGAVSSYDVEARINSTVIWRGAVHGHTRADGWEALVKRIAAVAESYPRSRAMTPPRQAEEGEQWNVERTPTRVITHHPKCARVHWPNSLYSCTCWLLPKEPR